VPELQRLVATYERVSSEDQRQRETILLQTQELARHLDVHPEVTLVRQYVDDGVSGITPIRDRPAGCRLMSDAASGLFEEVWVYKLDRLGRDEVDQLVARRDFDALGIKVHSVTEGISTPFEYGIRVLMSAEERRVFLARSAAGLERVVRAGRYPGGIAPYGYAVEGERKDSRLVPDDGVVWGDLTAADVIRKIFHLLAENGYSSVRVAEELNQQGIPTAYRMPRRAMRGKLTQGVWRPGRIHQIVKNTTYRGEYRYGKRSKKTSREIISVPIPRLVSDEIWYVAQDVLAARRWAPSGRRRNYLLKSRLKCEVCRLNYSGTISHGDVWYRCNGALVGRGRMEGRCYGKGVKGVYIEAKVWDDIERFLREPGDLLSELTTELEVNGDSAAATKEAERVTLGAARDGVKEQRERLLDLYVDGQFDRSELDHQMNDIKERSAVIEARLRDLEPDTEPLSEMPHRDLLDELRYRLNHGLSDDQKQEIVSLLVRRITIHTTVGEDAKKTARAVVEYAFPTVVETHADTGSWPLPA
jgi:site-specific DNA recombinase